MPWADTLRRLWPARRSPAIPDALWQHTLQQHPFLGWRSAEDLARLRLLSADFLRRKEFHGAHGLVITDDMALSVAAQACLPVLQLGLPWYDGFVGIVMHEGPVLARRSFQDDAGLVHEYDEELVGEALEGGPVMLSWQSGVEPSSAFDEAPAHGPAFNVVIHEFVHVMDMRDGEVDGVPALQGAARQAWCNTLDQAWDRFSERAACGYDSVIDDYGAHDVGEFFAVAAEAFFTRPRAFQMEQPALHRLFCGFFRQDPTLQAPDPAEPGR